MTICHSVKDITWPNPTEEKKLLTDILSGFSLGGGLAGGSPWCAYPPSPYGKGAVRTRGRFRLPTSRVKNSEYPEKMPAEKFH